MRILHTADIHLHSEHPRRLETLSNILQLGRDERIDLLLIAGDLFDDHHQAELLRASVRALFDRLPFTVLAIPGNHDQRAFAEESFYGPDFRGLTGKPFTTIDFPDFRLLALPYDEVSFAALREDISRACAPDKKNILLLHCSWSLPFYNNDDYGGEDLRYLPVTEATLTGLGVDWILAGHFHTSYRQRILPCGAMFVYPGSPISITSREQGRRSVNLLDADGCRPLTLESPYYQDLDYTLTVTNTESILAQIARESALHSDADCTLTVRLTGFCQETEAALVSRLEKLLAGRANTRIEALFRSANEIFADPLYQRIQRLLVQGQACTDAAQAILLDAFSQILAEDR